MVTAHIIKGIFFFGAEVPKPGTLCTFLVVPISSTFHSAPFTNPSSRSKVYIQHSHWDHFQRITEKRALSFRNVVSNQSEYESVTQQFSGTDRFLQRLSEELNQKVMGETEIHLNHRKALQDAGKKEKMTNTFICPSLYKI